MNRIVKWYEKRHLKQEVRRIRKEGMMPKLLNVLLLRFLPHRTAIGVGLFLISEILGVFQADAACGVLPAACAFAAKAQAILTPWLVIAGIRDKERK